MHGEQKHSAEVAIDNPLGFHVRPVQRFADLAQVFESDVEVELRGATVPGKSVMNLMSLGGQQGDVLKITARGRDARQCVEVLRFLAANNFFVEDDLEPGSCCERHLQRLAHIASCFESRITAQADGDSVDAKDVEALRRLELKPSAEPGFEIEGKDADLARAVINNLVGHCFYVEEQMVQKAQEGG
jgi:phosphotransferase system HPr (HPr) family protein